MKIEKELLLSFSEQFAENQNQHQQSFIQVLSVILTVLIGYGYIYSNGGTFIFDGIKNYDFNISISFCVATLINTFGILLVCSNAHGYRRDQFVVSKIRRNAGILSNKNKKDKIFPFHFDPALSLKVKTEKFNESNNYFLFDFLLRWIHYKVSWMPNFYNILFFVLVSMQFGLLASIIFNPYDNFELLFNCNFKIHWYYLAAIFVWLILTIYFFERNDTFMKKLTDLYKE